LVQHLQQQGNGSSVEA